MRGSRGLRGWLFGTGSGPFTRAAIALTIVGVLFLLVEIQSPSALFWTGQAVTGTNSGGIVYYHVNGEQYTIDAPGPAPAHDTPVTVYVDPHDPTHALAETPAKWVDAAMVLGWFVLAAACVLVGLLRRRAYLRKRAAVDPAGDIFGEGFDSARIEHYLERSQSRYRPGPRRPPAHSPAERSHDDPERDRHQ